jgi:hypothetical protein
MEKLFFEFGAIKSGLMLSVTEIHRTLFARGRRLRRRGLCCGPGKSPLLFLSQPYEGS